MMDGASLLEVIRGMAVNCCQFSHQLKNVIAIVTVEAFKQSNRLFIASFCLLNWHVLLHSEQIKDGF